jgi:hypothetical protein
LLGQLNVGTKPDYDYEHEHEHELEQDKISQFGIGTLFSIVFFFFVLSVPWWLGAMPSPHGGTEPQRSLRINLAVNYSYFIFIHLFIFFFFVNFAAWRLCVMLPALTRRLSGCFGES